MLAVAGVIVSVYALMVVVMGWSGGSSPLDSRAGLPWSWELFGVTAAVVGGGILLGSLFKLMRLSGGGEVVARDLGARQVDPNTRDPAERRLLNVVEEMSVASGMVTPGVWVMDEENGINAFAAGTDPSNAVVAVSNGALRDLSRAELQGVVAHEFSHILNGDMKMNMRLIGWLFGILMISMVGRMLLHSLRFSRGGGRGRNDGGGAAMALIVGALGLMAIGAIGVLFGRLIQAAISRQREYLADAAAVQFTRDPSGIAGALKKIGRNAMEGRVTAAKASEASHMFFANAGMFSFGFSTHPPLDVRIRAIERDWDGSFGDMESSEASSAPRSGRSEGRAAAMHGGGAAVAASTLPPPLPAGLEGRGAPQLAAGIALVNSLNDGWRETVHTPEGGRALVFGLLLSDDETLRESELKHLAAEDGEQIAEEAARWSEQLASVHSSKKIALVEIAVPALRRLNPDQYQKFKALMRWLVESDGRIELFELMLGKLVERHLDTAHGLRATVKTRYRHITDLESEAHLLVSAMAHLGDDPGAAYLAAMAEYQAHGGKAHGMLEPSATTLVRIDAALERCDAATPLVKRQLLRMCALAAASDGVLADQEVELLRTIADAVGSQIPLEMP